MSDNVLIVDSDADVRRLLTVRLSKAQYQVVEAASVEDALDVAATLTPDIVISEVRLPGLSGLDLVRRLKTMQTPPLCLLLTALARDTDIAAGLAAGADDYMLKPFSPLVLLERLRVNLIRTGREVPAAALIQDEYANG